MKVCTLHRVVKRGGSILGILEYDDQPLALTCELEWRDNRRNESCIPKGWYECHPHSSGKFGKTWEICDVAERSAIIFHRGNTRKDSRGCVIVGSKFGVLDGLPAVLASREAMDKLRRTIGVDNAFLLNVRDYTCRDCSY